MVLDGHYQCAKMSPLGGPGVESSTCGRCFFRICSRWVMLDNECCVKKELFVYGIVLLYEAYISWKDL